MSPSTQTSAPPPSRNTFARRVTGIVVVSAILFLVLWVVVFTAVQSALVASGAGGILVMGSSASDMIETVVDVIVDVVLGILSAIGSFFAGLFGFGD